MEKEKILQIFASATSKSDVCRAFNWSINGSGLRRVQKLIEEYNISTAHFDQGKKKHIKYQPITKICPICSTPFQTKKGIQREKITCSKSCANTYFRRGRNNGNWKNDTYRSTCFEKHPHKCAVCPEDKILTVHHFDGNRTNNKVENLIPLCPTHHQYWHSRYRKKIEQKVIEYRNNFIKNILGSSAVG